MEKDSLVSVSPPVGMRAVLVTRSTFREPITDMIAGLDDMAVGCNSFWGSVGK